MGKVTKRNLRSLLTLIADGEIRASQFNDAALEKMLISTGCVRKERITKSSYKYVLLDEKGLRLCCADYNIQLRNLEQTYHDMENGELYVKPSGEILKFGKDHVRKRNLWKGFFLKSNQELKITYNGMRITLPPYTGFLVEFPDRFSMQPVDDYTLWIVENYECFQNLDWLSRFGFDGEKILVTSRFPNLSASAREAFCQWKVSNRRYFGDLDLGGVNIFQTEFAPKIGPEKLFIPPTIREDLTEYGSPHLFNEQKEKYKNITPITTEIEQLLNLIFAKQKALLQEFYLIDKDDLIKIVPRARR